MSGIEPSVVAATKLLIELDGNSSSVTLRVKPDRRRRQMSFPKALERRIGVHAVQLTEAAVFAALPRSASQAVSSAWESRRNDGGSSGEDMLARHVAASKRA